MELHEFEEKVIKREYPIVKVSTIKSDFLTLEISHYVYEDLESTRTVNIPVIDLTSIFTGNKDALTPYINIINVFGEGIVKFERNGTLYIFYLYKYDWSFDVVFNNIKSYYEDNSNQKVVANALKKSTLDNLFDRLKEINDDEKEKKGDDPDA